jgi:hypothetical protein
VGIKFHTHNKIIIKKCILNEWIRSAATSTKHNKYDRSREFSFDVSEKGHYVSYLIFYSIIFLLSSKIYKRMRGLSSL